MNAKELILNKINAGPDLAGSYINMLLQGIDFADIAEFMVSPTIDAVVKRSKSNVFNGTESSIDKAISFYLDGPNLEDYFNPRQLDTLRYYINNHQKAFFDLMSKDGQKYFTKDNGNMKMFVFSMSTYFKFVIQEDNLAEFVELLAEVVPKDNNGEFIQDYEKISFDNYQEVNNDPRYEEYDSNIRKPLNRFINIMGDSFSDDIEIGKLINFKQIYDDAKETHLMGRRLGINMGIGTNLYEHYKYNNQLRVFFLNKIYSNIDSFEGEQRNELLLKIGIFTDPTKFHSQMDNAEFRKFVIDAYDVVKGKFNIFNVENESPHFNAMMDAQVSLINMFREVSTRYDHTYSLIEKLTNEQLLNINNGLDHTFSEDEVKAVERFIVADFTNKFMNQSNIEFVINEGDYYYNSKLEYTQAKGDVILNLNTREGRMSFKIFMDTHKDEFRKLSANTDGNAFLDNLTMDIKKDPVTSEEYEFLKLDIDMNNIKDDIDQIQFQEMSNGFRYLKTVPFKNIKGQSIADAFFIYNLLVNNNAFGKAAFTKIFENDLQPGEKNIISEFFRFVGDVDYSKFTNTGDLYGQDPDIDYLCKTLATQIKSKDGLYGYHGLYVKIWNNTSKRYDFFKYIEGEEGKKGKYESVNIGSSYTNIPSYLYDLKQSGEIDFDMSTSNPLLDEAQMNLVMEEYQNGNIKLLVKC